MAGSRPAGDGDGSGEPALAIDVQTCRTARHDMARTRIGTIEHGTPRHGWLIVSCRARTSCRRRGPGTSRRACGRAMPARWARRPGVLVPTRARRRGEPAACGGDSERCREAVACGGDGERRGEAAARDGASEWRGRRQAAGRAIGGSERRKETAARDGDGERRAAQGSRSVGQMATI